jgi:uncharacterized membrane protein
MTKTVTAIFRTRQTAEEALHQLETAGFTHDAISVLMTDDTRKKSFKIVENSKADEGMAAGATFGGLLGAVLASVAAAGAIAIPGLNLIVAGSLISGLAGLGAGAATGGLIGALIGAGIPEHEAKTYEKELAGGSVLIAVEAKDSSWAEKAEKIFKNLNAMNVAA